MFTKFLLFTISIVISSTGQNFLAVMDLVGDGSVGKKDLIAISNTISQSVTDSSYFQFDRSTLPELLRQFNMDDSSISCYDPQCLILIGNLIGANTVIGGFISSINDSFDVKLYLVDVVQKNTINSISIRSGSLNSFFFETILPHMVNNLIAFPHDTKKTASAHSQYEITSVKNDRTPSQKVKNNEIKYSSGKKNYRNRRPVVMGGIGGTVGLSIIGLAIFSAIKNNSELDETTPLSMDDAPLRIRYR